MKRRVRIGIVDSGVNAAHPHIGGIAGGISIDGEGSSPDYLDRLGHGTAVAALIHSLAPEAALLCARVFDRNLATSIAQVIRAIDWCLENGAGVVNLSLGTANPAHRADFVAALERVESAGAVLVSAFEIEGRLMLPGSLPGAVGVTADPECGVHRYRRVFRDGKLVFRAPPFPRQIPGVPPFRNIHGVSFAVAHISAHLASAQRRSRRPRSPLRSPSSPENGQAQAWRA